MKRVRQRLGRSRQQLLLTDKHLKLLSEDVQIKFIEGLRWKKEIYCSYCGRKNKIQESPDSPFLYTCNEFHHRTFSVLDNTIFENTEIPLSIWFLIIGTMLKDSITKNLYDIHNVVTKTGYIISLDALWNTCMKIRAGMAYDDGYFNTRQLMEKFRIITNDEKESVFNCPNDSILELRFSKFYETEAIYLSKNSQENTVELFLKHILSRDRSFKNKDSICFDKPNPSRNHKHFGYGLAQTNVQTTTQSNHSKTNFNCHRCGSTEKNSNGSCVQCLLNISSDRLLSSELHKELHLFKNNLPDTDRLTLLKNSTIILWWKCIVCDCEWEATATSRSAGHKKCPNCVEKNKKYYSLFETFPETKKYFDFPNNEPLASERIFQTKETLIKSKFNWITDSGCRIVCSVNEVVNILKKHPKLSDVYQSVGEKFPELCSLWDEKLNNGKTAFEVLVWDESVVFKCEKCHCPRTSSRTVYGGSRTCYECHIKSFDRSEIIQHLIDTGISLEWDTSKNGELNSENLLLSRDNDDAWWKCCDCGYEWQQCAHHSLGIRSSGRSCPKCNSLLAKFEEIAKEWNFEKNGTLLPSQVPFWSTMSAHWSCINCQDEWEQSIRDRTKIGTIGCDKCNNFQSSLPERKLAYCLSLAFGESVKQHQSISLVTDTPLKNGNKYKKYTPDVVITNGVNNPVVVQFDGWYFHKNKIESDVRISNMIEASGFLLIRVREGEVDSVCKNEISIETNSFYTDNNVVEVTKKIIEIIKGRCELEAHIQESVSLFLNKDFSGFVIPIDQMYPMLKKNNLCVTHPEIAAEWDFDRNGNLKPQQLTEKSSYIAHWICRDCRRDFTKGVNIRVKNEEVASKDIICKCNRCLDRRTSETDMGDFNLLEESFMKEWNFDLNNILPNEIKIHNYNTKIHWTCIVCGQGFMMSVYRRINGLGCTCKGVSINVAGVSIKNISPKNILAVKYPHLSNEWDSNKNNSIMPNDLTFLDGRISSWRCLECGFEWNEKIINRTIYGKGCLCCQSEQQLLHNDSVIMSNF